MLQHDGMDAADAAEVFEYASMRVQQLCDLR